MGMGARNASVSPETTMRTSCLTAQRRELSGECRVGDTDHRWAGDVGSTAECLGCKCNDPLGQRLISAEVS